MKLLGNTKNKITEDNNGESIPYLKITEVILMHCNIVNNDYQYDSRVLYTFVANKSFRQLLNISTKKNPFKSEFPYLEVWFTYQKLNR